MLTNFSRIVNKYFADQDEESNVIRDLENSNETIVIFRGTLKELHKFYSAILNHEFSEKYLYKKNASILSSHVLKAVLAYGMCSHLDNYRLNKRIDTMKRGSVIKYALECGIVEYEKSDKFVTVKVFKKFVPKTIEDCVALVSSIMSQNTDKEKSRFYAFGENMSVIGGLEVNDVGMGLKESDSVIVGDPTANTEEKMST